MSDLSLINQGELFGTSSDEIKAKIIYETSNKLPKNKESILSFYKNLDEDLKLNHTVCKHIFSKNGMALSLAPDEILKNYDLALIAIATDIEAFDYISENLKEDIHILETLIKKDPFYAFLKITFTAFALLQQKNIDTLLFEEILKTKNKDIKISYIKPILNIIFNIKNLSSTLSVHDLCDELITKFII